MKFKLLIADDSTLVRNNLKRLLSDVDSLNIIESRDAESTVVKLKQESPNLILLDLRMPKGSGYDVLNFIKTQNTKPIVIVLTNSSNPESRKRCMDDGADFFFDKSKQHKEAISEVKKIVISSSKKGFADE